MSTPPAMVYDPLDDLPRQFRQQQPTKEQKVHKGAGRHRAGSHLPGHVPCCSQPTAVVADFERTGRGGATWRGVAFTTRRYGSDPAKCSAHPMMSEAEAADHLVSSAIRQGARVQGGAPHGGVQEVKLNKENQVDTATHVVDSDLFVTHDVKSSASFAPAGQPAQSTIHTPSYTYASSLASKIASLECHLKDTMLELEQVIREKDHMFSILEQHPDMNLRLQRHVDLQQEVPEEQQATIADLIGWSPGCVRCSSH